MQEDVSAKRARLVKALTSLRAILDHGPQEQFPFGIAYTDHSARGAAYPRANQARLAVVAARAAIAGGDQTTGFLDVSLAPRRTLEELDHFLLFDVGQLDRLPAPRSILRKLHESIKDWAALETIRRRAVKPRKPRNSRKTDRSGADRRRVQGQHRGGSKTPWTGPEHGSRSLQGGAGQTRQRGLSVQRQDTVACPGSAGARGRCRHRRPAARQRRRGTRGTKS